MAHLSPVQRAYQGCAPGVDCFKGMTMHRIRHYMGLYRLLRINNTPVGALLALLRKPSF